MYRGMLCACVVIGIATPVAKPDEPRKLKVLVIEALPRLDYKFLRVALHRDARFDPKFLLTSADPGAVAQDPAYLGTFPDRRELFDFDVVVLGEIDPKELPRAGKELLADYVTEGGGLVVAAGVRHTPHGWKDTKLANVMPISLDKRPESPVVRSKGYRPVLTEAGKKHPAFVFKPGDKEEEWNDRPELYGWTAGVSTKPQVEVLAVHPTEKTDRGDPLPLIVAHKYGKGTCMYVGFDDAWRWRKLNPDRHTQFWMALIQSTARIG